MTQSQKFDPQGKFIRKYGPGLAGGDDKFIHCSWPMTAARQRKANMVIGRDYPAPVVDHDAVRKRTLELCKSVKR